MDGYKLGIGLYNSKVENKEGLEICDIVFDNYEDLKNHIRKNDTVILKSGFSIYDVDSYEIVKIIEEYNLEIRLLDDLNNRKHFDKFSITMLSAINDYIKQNLDIIKKLN